jgi:hypothetical protein
MTDMLVGRSFLAGLGEQCNLSILRKAIRSAVDVDLKTTDLRIVIAGNPENSHLAKPDPEVYTWYTGGGKSNTKMAKSIYPPANDRAVQTYDR